MKVNGRVQTKIKGDNRAELKAWNKEALVKSPYYPLLAMLAEMCDDLSAGEQVFVTIGATSQRNAFSLTVNMAGVKDAIYAGGFCDLAQEAGRWLDEPVSH